MDQNPRNRSTEAAAVAGQAVKESAVTQVIAKEQSRLAHEETALVMMTAPDREAQRAPKRRFLRTVALDSIPERVPRWR